MQSHVGTAEAECDSVRTTSTDRTLGALENNIPYKITYSAVQNLDWKVMGILLCILKFK